MARVAPEKAVPHRPARFTLRTPAEALVWKEKRPVKYKGILAKPIAVAPPPPRGILSTIQPDKEALDKFWEEISAERLKRLIALLGHYDIDPSSPHSLVDLAFRLADAHVPGFRLAAPRGRPKKNDGLGGALWMEVRLMQLKSTRPLSASRACDLLARKKKEKAPTLRRRYTAANKFWSRLFDKIPKPEQLRILESPFGETTPRERIEQALLAD